MFTTKNGNGDEIANINQFFDKNWEGNIKQLDDHLKKADFVPLDFRNLNEKNQNKLLDYIKTLPEKKQIKIVIMR